MSRDLALDYGVRGLSTSTWRVMFDKGLTPQEAALAAKPDTSTAKPEQPSPPR